MERKLIKQGGGGYTIYLPKKWVEKKTLKEGDSIKIRELGTSLLVDSESKDDREITIDLDKYNREDLQIILTHAYRKGYNRIIIENFNKDLIKRISTWTKDFLLGFEVTEKNDSKCKLENISEPTEQKYETILRKIFFLINELNDLIAEDFCNNYKNYEEIQELKKNIDKFVLFCRRVLIKEKYEKEIILEWEFLTFLNHIGHSYFYAYNYSKENKIKVNKNVSHFFTKLKEYFSLLQDSYLEQNIEKIHKINDLKKEYHFGEIIKLLEKSKGSDTVLVAYIKDIFRLIQIGSSPVLSMLLKTED